LRERRNMKSSMEMREPEAYFAPYSGKSLPYNFLGTDFHHKKA